ncbi:MAG: ferrochelatase [Alphaproteobacteria bacterium]
MTDTAHLPESHPDAPSGRIGVLLIALGTPDAATPEAVKRFLKQFLSDRRVIELPPLLWQPILRGIVLNVRPKKVAHAYEMIWMQEPDESPLRYYTRAQSDGVASAVSQSRNDVIVDWAMRYGTPSVADRLRALKDQGCDRILTVALYPQYSATTTASAYDAVFEALSEMRWQPAIRTAPPFHDDAAYIDALAGSVEGHLAALDYEPQAVIASYHGIPEPYFLAGDPYHCHCAKTNRLLGERLGWGEDRLRMTFQSRFGFQEWLRPYTDETLEALPGEGIKRIAVLAPAFLSDCLETLEEIAMQGRDTFLEAGGEAFSYIPCLNDSDGAIGTLTGLVERELSGWA